MKMSDVFALPVWSKLDEGLGLIILGEDCAVISEVESTAYSEAILHAINTHDQLVEENERLKQELASRKLIDSDFTVGSLNQIKQYIDEFGPDTDLDVIKAELGELVLRLKGEYL